MLEFWIDSDSAGEVEEHLRLAAAHGVHSVQFLLHRPEQQRGPLSLAEAARQHLRAAAELARRGGLRTNLDALVAEPSNGRVEPAARCALPWLRAYVDLDGRAGPCVDWVTKARSDADMALDDVASGGPHECFSGPAFRSLRASFRAGEAPHAICSGCTKGRLASLRGAARARA